MKNIEFANPTPMKDEDVNMGIDNSVLKGNASPLIDIHLKKLEKMQWLVVSDAKCKLYEQLCQYTQLGNKEEMRGGIIIVAKGQEEAEYEVAMVKARDGTIYAELETIDRRKIKLANA